MFPTFVWKAELKPDVHQGINGNILRKLDQLRDTMPELAPGQAWQSDQNGYVERLIGSIRSECLDHVIVFGEAHLRRILTAYAKYYNGTRTHLSLGKDAPFARPILWEGQIKSVPHLGGLHHSYVRI